MRLSAIVHVIINGIWDSKKMTKESLCTYG